MATKIVMEALSPTMEEGRLVKWTKQVGDAVKSGDTLAEVETDKGVMELVARSDGQLLQQAVAEGATVPVGNLIGFIGAPGEKVDGGGRGTGDGGKAAAAPTTPARPAVSSQPGRDEPRTGRRDPREGLAVGPAHRQGFRRRLEVGDRLRTRWAGHQA